MTWYLPTFEHIQLFAFEIALNCIPPPFFLSIVKKRKFAQLRNWKITTHASFNWQKILPNVVCTLYESIKAMRFLKFFVLVSKHYPFFLPLFQKISIVVWRPHPFNCLLRLFLPWNQVICYYPFICCDGLLFFFYMYLYMYRIYTIFLL